MTDEEHEKGLDKLIRLCRETDRLVDECKWLCAKIEVEKIVARLFEKAK